MYIYVYIYIYIHIKYTYEYIYIYIYIKYTYIYKYTHMCKPWPFGFRVLRSRAAGLRDLHRFQGYRDLNPTPPFLPAALHLPPPPPPKKKKLKQK